MRFLAFISVFLTIYGLAHFYAFLKVQKAFSLARGTSAILAVFLLLMVFSPVIARLSERHAPDALSLGIALAAFVWMGFVFLFVSAALLTDIYGLIGAAVKHLFHRNVGIWIPSARGAFWGTLIASALAAAYGYGEALTIRERHVTIQTTKLPSTMERFRIVQISDIHLGRIVGEKRLENILAKVRKARPDLLVSTGDLVDGQMTNGPGLAGMFQGISAPYGKYAILGNHEFYAGLDRSLRFTSAAGFQILRGTGVPIGEILFVAGVDDAAGHRYGRFEGDTEEALLSGVPPDRFALLLKHRPYVNQAGPRHFDLQLSGHTHGGQIFPFSIIIRMLYPEDAGLLRLKGGGYLYVNRGAGTWGPPIRFLAPPEISIIDLVQAKGQR